MAIRTECIVNLKEVDFIMATCSKCKSEIRVQAGKIAPERCSVCQERYSPSQQFALSKISEAIDLLNQDSDSGDIQFIKIED